MIFTVVFSAIASSYIVNADELDGYTKIDWSWNRDMETTDANSVIVGGNIPFWRYVNAENPENNAIWKSIYGDELSDDDVTKIWLGDIDKRYVVASVDVANIPDENIRQYIYDHIDEDLPDLKFKFDIDADVEGDDNDKKASKLFNGDIGYRVYRDGDTCRIEIKFSPKFYLTDNKDNSSRIFHICHINHYLKHVIHIAPLYSLCGDMKVALTSIMELWKWLRVTTRNIFTVKVLVTVIY